jgi:hypothetical protein
MHRAIVWILERLVVRDQEFPLRASQMHISFGVPKVGCLRFMIHLQFVVSIHRNQTIF